jgi:hypothetical protein
MLQRIKPVTAYIRLEHIKPDGDRLIETTPVPRKQSAEFVEGVIDEYSGLASDHCDHLAGNQTFAIVCHDSNARDIGRRQWDVKGALEEDSHAAMPANMAGMFAQLQMQNRFLFDYTYKMTMLFGQSMTEENSRLRTVEKEYHDKRMGMWNEREELEDQKHAREIELVGLQNRFAKQDRLFGMLEKTFGPKVREVINETMKGEKSNGKANAKGGDADGVDMGQAGDDFVASLSEEQQIKIVDILTSEQQRMISGPIDVLLKSLKPGQWVKLLAILDDKQRDMVSSL